MKPRMTKAEMALFLLADGNRLDRPERIHYETGHAPDSEENRFLVNEVKRVNELWEAAGRPDMKDCV